MTSNLVSGRNLALRAFVAAAAWIGQAAPAPGGGQAISVTSEVVVAPANQPTFMTCAPGDPDRLFYTERPGLIRVIEGGQLVAEPFLDISALVNESAYEGALAALAFDLGYQDNGYFYVTYMSLANESILARFSVTSDPLVADPVSCTALLTVPHPDTTHNVGWIGFGPDGYLYIGSGDGGATTFGQFAQDPESLFGKILRVDVGGPDPYGIPPDNPFVGGPGRDEIWLLGLRNPWRCSFDRLTGDFWIADVGSATWEEIDVQPAGAPGGTNFGWSCREGPACHFPSSGCACPDSSLTAPVHVYGHVDGCAVIGGYVYRGSAIAPLVGHYVFGDCCSGRVWALDPADGSIVHLLTAPVIFSFAEDSDGELYILKSDAILKIVPTDCNANKVPDYQDISGGASTDCDVNGVPDECQSDCNGNMLPDTCDIASGKSTDHNANGIPDECDVSADLNGDGTVGAIDFLLMIIHWGECPPPCPPGCFADLDGDCDVGPLDLVIMFAAWG